MRILQVVHGWPPQSAGGTGLYVGALVSALRTGPARQSGHDVTVLAPGPRPGITRSDGLTQIGLRPPSTWEETWQRPDGDALFRQVLRRLRPEVVHIHHLAGLSFGFLREARQSGARVVLTLHDYAIVCARGQLVTRQDQLCPGPTANRCAACMTDQLRLDPITAMIGGWLSRWPAVRSRARASLGPRPGDLRRAGDRLAAARSALALAHELISPSHDLARRIAAIAPVQPTVLDLPLVRPVPPAPDPGTGPLRLLFAGGIIPTKGVHRLVEAFARLPAGAATLTVAGPTPPFDGKPDYGARIEKRVRSLPGARWLGHIRHADMPGILADHDVFVLPSTWPENSPLIVREATAAGLRVIVGEDGGARELAPDARTVPRDDDNALLACLSEEVRLGRMRKEPRDWPSAQAHASALLELYDTAT